MYQNMKEKTFEYDKTTGRIMPIWISNWGNLSLYRRSLEEISVFDS